MHFLYLHHGYDRREFCLLCSCIFPKRREFSAPKLANMANLANIHEGSYISKSLSAYGSLLLTFSPFCLCEFVQWIAFICKGDVPLYLYVSHRVSHISDCLHLARVATCPKLRFKRSHMRLLKSYNVASTPKFKVYFFFSFNELGPLDCSMSKLTSETMNYFRNFGRTPWMGDRPTSCPLPTKDRAAQKYANIHPCPYRDSYPWSLGSSGFGTIKNSLSFPRVKRSGREADHSPKSTAEVKSSWSYTSTSSICDHGVVLN
jgi:hypothetical protein